MFNPHTLICFSNLRWNFVFQRPQNLMSRFARIYNTFYIEDPVFGADKDHYVYSVSEENVKIIVPHLQNFLSKAEIDDRLQSMLQDILSHFNISNYIFWYCSASAIHFTRGFTPKMTIFDNDNQQENHEELSEDEREVYAKADIVFTGGHELYESGKKIHSNIHPFPSCVDKNHFMKARNLFSDPEDQAHIPHPRLGYCGVIDNRIDFDLIRKIALEKPEWHIILVGPIVKIDQNSLPQLPNIHFPGIRTYNELPAYIAGWDVALVPFKQRLNNANICPTKTPEYLAAGKPVISSAIKDVVRNYGNRHLINIATSAEEFIEAAEKELDNLSRTNWLLKVDEILAESSWDDTWRNMMTVITDTKFNLVSKRETPVKRKRSALSKSRLKTSR